MECKNVVNGIGRSDVQMGMLYIQSSQHGHGMFNQIILVFTKLAY